MWTTWVNLFPVFHYCGNYCNYRRFTVVTVTMSFVNEQHNYSNRQTWIITILDYHYEYTALLHHNSRQLKVDKSVWIILKLNKINSFHSFKHFLHLLVVTREKICSSQTCLSVLCRPLSLLYTITRLALRGGSHLQYHLTHSCHIHTTTACYTQI